jgi:exonuclease III
MLDGGERPERRSALVDKELHCHNINIAALQETRLQGQGQLKEEHYTFFWVGKNEGRRVAGVAFAGENRIAGKLLALPVPHSERLMTLRIPIENNRHLTLINVYAPTMTYTDEEKEAHYQQLSTLVDDVPDSDKLIILGDFNARVGTDDHTYSSVLGKFGKGQKNSNGQLLLNFCAQQDLCLTNTFSDSQTRTFSPGNTQGQTTGIFSTTSSPERAGCRKSPAQRQ